MSPAKKTLFASRKGKRGNFIYVVMTLGLAGVAGWILYHSQPESNQPVPTPVKSSKPESATPHPAAKLTPLDLQPTRNPNLPVPAAPVAATNKPVAAEKPVYLPPPAERITPLTNLDVSHPAAAVSNPIPTTLPPANIVQGFPRPVKSVLEAQIALVWQGISPGSIDGSMGSQTHAALSTYQADQKLPLTGQLDAVTRSNLTLEDEPFTTYVITSNDLARLQPIAPTWLGKSQQTALDFENILELVSEKSFSNPALIRQLNPALNWSNVVAGTVAKVPNAQYPDDPPKAAYIVIHLSARTLEGFDSGSNLICHFPCSIAKRVEKRPVGQLKVDKIAIDPNYTWDPAVFPESPESHTIDHKLILPPGPNNPVGVAWIGLDKPGYGMHGTPRPEDVGRTESHGCFRLANWNARYLAHIVTVGTPVWVLE